MAPINIRGQTVELEVEAELREFNWTRPRWTSDKLIAASPFRYDNTPSFFVRLEPFGDYPAGTWSDSGAYDAEWASGGIVKLLAFLRNETQEETEDYLLAQYCRNDDREDITLHIPTLKLRSTSKYIASDYIDRYSINFDYLQSRGISAGAQREAGIRYDSISRAVVIPWFDANNRLRNVKYRTTYGKTFWYHRGATPVRELIYGIESVGGPVAVLEEAEIDALSWRTVGVQSIAVGGANFTDKQADIIKRSPIEQLYISGDNDKAGRKFAEQVTAKLRGHLELRKISKPGRFKDTNEALMAGDNIQDFLVSSINVDNFRLDIAKILL